MSPTGLLSSSTTMRAPMLCLLSNASAASPARWAHRLRRPRHDVVDHELRQVARQVARHVVSKTYRRAGRPRRECRLQPKCLRDSVDIASGSGVFATSGTRLPVCMTSATWLKAAPSLPPGWNITEIARREAARLEQSDRQRITERQLHHRRRGRR